MFLYSWYVNKIKSDIKVTVVTGHPLQVGINFILIYDFLDF